MTSHAEFLYCLHPSSLSSTTAANSFAVLHIGCIPFPSLPSASRLHLVQHQRCLRTRATSRRELPLLGERQKVSRRRFGQRRSPPQIQAVSPLSPSLSLSHSLTPLFLPFSESYGCRCRSSAQNRHASEKSPQRPSRQNLCHALGRRQTTSRFRLSRWKTHRLGRLHNQ